MVVYRSHYSVTVPKYLPSGEQENESTVSELKRELEQTRDGNESSLQEMVFVLKKEVESMKTTLEVSVRLTTNVVYSVFHSLYACSIGIVVVPPCTCITTSRKRYSLVYCPYFLCSASKS